MALTATIYKAQLNISDMDRHYYAEHSLTLAKHPSETDERLMIRLLAFALNAHEDLQFTKGISTDDEPDIWLKSPSGEIDLWIELGLPDERRLRKACGRAKQVLLYTYGGGRMVPIWWQKIESQLQRFDNLVILDLPLDSTKALAELAARNMDLQCMVQDGQVTLIGESGQVEVLPEVLKGA